MANDTATLAGHLATALRDTTHEVWTSPEKTNLITWALARLYPAIMKYTTQNISTTQGQPWLNVGSGAYPFARIHRIDLWDGDPTVTSNRMMMEIPANAWEVQQELVSGSSSRVVINPIFANYGGSYYVVHGYIPYDGTTNLVPDHLVPLVIARARAEAYRRMGADRAQFKNWLVANQEQQVSVNELLQLISEAGVEAELLEQKYSSHHKKPVLARR